MKVPTVLGAVLATQATASVALGSNGYSESQIIETILQNPQVLPASSYKWLSEQVNVLSKRSPQDAPAAPAGKGAKGAGGLDLSSLLGGLLGTPKGAPQSKVAERQEMAPQIFPNAKRVKVRYGPYRLPATSEKGSQMMGMQGIANTLKVGARKPCDGNCTMLSVIAGMEYADGSSADNDNGAWYHHSILINTGPNARDPRCGAQTPIENVFMSGNEKTDFRFGLPGAKIKSGYRLTPQDTFTLNTQLMNMNDKEKWVWVTFTYEYLDGLFPEYRDGRIVWMSIGTLGALGALGCGGGKGAGSASQWGATNLTVMGYPKSMVFSEHSVPWEAQRDGVILTTGGHMHDGGINIEIVQNGKVICNSVAQYAKGKGGMGHKKRQVLAGDYSNNDIEHIFHQPGCIYPEGSPIKKGDKVWIKANYDFNKRPGMKNTRGELDEVMGISGTLVAL